MCFQLISPYVADAAHIGKESRAGIMFEGEWRLSVYAVPLAAVQDDTDGATRVPSAWPPPGLWSNRARNGAAALRTPAKREERGGAEKGISVGTLNRAAGGEDGAGPLKSPLC